MAKLYTLLKASMKQVRKIILKDLAAAGYEDIQQTNDFIYAAGDIPVLLMAHMDTAFDKPPKYIYNTDGVLSAEKGLGADDRAGIFGVLEIIKTHKCHVLFTDGEERGCIGADAFTQSGIKPEVNYCIELDRRGENDAVYYDGGNEDFEEYVTNHGWVTAWGSFTDICEVAPYLGVSAVNLSIGYQNEHRANETLDTKVMNENIERAKQMLDGPKFEWVENPYNRWGGYDDWFDERDPFRYERRPGDRRDEWKEWVVVFYDKDGNDMSAGSIGRSYEEAIGFFLIDRHDLCYDDICDCIEYDEYDRYMDRPQLKAM